MTGHDIFDQTVREPRRHLLARHGDTQEIGASIISLRTLTRFSARP
jgi:hypothetical protein